MSEFISWTPDNWYQAGTLAIQLALLVLAVWFTRNILKTARGFQEQVGALLRLSIAATPGELQSSDAIPKRPPAEVGSFRLTLPETQPVRPAEPIDSGPNVFVAAWRSVALWLNAPMTTSRRRPWRRVINWLQAPAGH